MHLLETARSLLFQSHVSTNLWGELTAAHLINRMPLSTIKFCTPYEVLHGFKPDLNYLRVFGCLCFASTSKVHRSKFDPRVASCVFLGYPTEHKAYKVMDLTTKRIFVTRDVEFHEKHLPFHVPISQSSPIYLPANILHSSEFHYDMHEPFLFNTTSLSSPSSPSSPSSSSTEIPIITIPFSPTQNSSPLSPPIPPPTTRHSHRLHNPPAWLHDYVATPTVTFHWCNVVHFQDLPSSLESLITQTTTFIEPESYLEASQNEGWIQAMKKEVENLKSNGTLELTPLPPNKKAIGCKWVFKVKLKADGTLERLKARLVAKVILSSRE